MRGRAAPMPCERCTRQEPDAYLWPVGTTEWNATCLLCRTQHIETYRSHSVAHHALSGHLLRTHGHRRVWIMEHDPTHEAAVQLALPLAVKLSAQARAGHSL